MKIKFQRFYGDAFNPTHNNAGDAGMDFYSLDLVHIDGNSFGLVRTGIRVEIPEGHVGLLFPKGKNDHLLGAGVIDTYYEGEVLFKVANPTNERLEIARGSAVGQMIIVPFVEPEPVMVGALLSRSKERGDSGGIKKDLT